MVDETVGASSGPATDRQNNPVIDPTKNVIALVKAGLERQDDLRAMSNAGLRREMEMRERFAEQLRDAESRRIDAIRAVDVAAVQRAAEVAAEAVQTLAAQVPITAEAVRTSLAAALNPILNDIAELRKVQYEQQGAKTSQTETHSNNQWTITLAVSLMFLAVAIGGFAVAIAVK